MSGAGILQTWNAMLWRYYPDEMVAHWWADFSRVWHHVAHAALAQQHDPGDEDRT